MKKIWSKTMKSVRVSLTKRHSMMMFSMCNCPELCARDGMEEDYECVSETADISG